MSLAKPPRLEQIFQIYEPPLYFVTLCTADRRKFLANETVHPAVIDYGERAAERGIALGRYVLMPDHIHLFVRGGPEFDLGIWMRGLKRVISAAVVSAAVSGGRQRNVPGDAPSPAAVTAAATTRRPFAVRSASLWQRGFFDHVLRNSDSYAQKWNYVHENPIRAGFVARADDWPFQGEITVIDRA